MTVRQAAYAILVTILFLWPVAFSRGHAFGLGDDAAVEASTSIAETFGLGGPVTVSTVTSVETFGLTDSARVATAVTVPVANDEWVWVNERVCVGGVCQIMPRLVRRTANAARVVASSVTPARLQVVSYADPAPVFQTATTQEVEWQTKTSGTYHAASDGILRHDVGPLHRLLGRLRVQRRSFIIYWR